MSTTKVQITSNPGVEKLLKQYPELARTKLENIRRLILETADELDEVSSIEETLKWGEPSYLTKHGSTIRMDWKAKKPEQYALYFQCSSRLVETFKIVFNKTFEYEGKRAIVFQMEDEIPRLELKSCIKAALIYHKVKHLPSLGI